MHLKSEYYQNDSDEELSSPDYSGYSGYNNFVCLEKLGLFYWFTEVQNNPIHKRQKSFFMTPRNYWRSQIAGVEFGETSGFDVIQNI